MCRCLLARLRRSGRRSGAPSKLASRWSPRATRTRSAGSTAHVAAYRWLLGETDVAPVTGRRVPACTAGDLAIEQAPGRDHAEQNTHAYNDPGRLYPEAVFDAISWARGQFFHPPSGY